MREYDRSINEDDKIRRTRERRNMIWRMEEEANSRIVLTDPIDEVRIKIAAYLKEKKGIITSLSELPLSGMGVNLYIKVSGGKETVYYHMETISGKKVLNSVTRDVYEISIAGEEDNMLYAQDNSGHNIEIGISGATLKEVTIQVYDSHRLRMLQKFANKDEGFWGIFYNYPEEQAALLFASLNEGERRYIADDKTLLKQIGNKLTTAQYARGLEKLDLPLNEKLSLIYNECGSFIDFQDLRGLLLSSGEDGKKLHDRLMTAFEPKEGIRVDMLIRGEDILQRYMSSWNKRRSSGKPPTMLYDDELDSKEIGLTASETTLVNDIVKKKKTLGQLSEDDKKKFLRAFKRNALKVTFEMLDLSEKAVISSSDSILKGEAQKIKDALLENAGSFKLMNQLDREISNASTVNPEDSNGMEALRLRERKKALDESVRKKLSPVAAILEDPKLDVQKLYNKFAEDEDVKDLENYLREHLGNVFENIQETRRIIREDNNQVYKLEGVVKRTKEQMNLPADVFGKIVDEKVSEIQWNDFMLSIGLAVVSLGLAIASFGTLTPLAAAVVATTSFAVSGVDFYYTYQNYTFEKTTSETSINPELALSFSNPSVIWVFASLAGAVSDFVSVVKLIKPAKLIHFSKTGEGGSEIISELEKAGKISKGFTATDLEKMMQKALEYKKTIKKQLLAMFDGKAVNLNELDEIADIYLAENFNKLQKMDDVEDFVKKDLPDWYDKKINNVKGDIQNESKGKDTKEETDNVKITDINAPHLLKGEGKVGTYKDLIKQGKRGDNLTPHHIPSDAYMKKHGISTDDGIAITLEHPHPGKGGRHRRTKTYGGNMTKAERDVYYNMKPLDALEMDVEDLRNIYKEDGLYDAKIEDMLQEVINENKKRFPNLFK